jgi:aspartyl-tRNA(Asn)/glutamyl-tRNA(Gln) amidotransferase subunit C
MDEKTVRKVAKLARIRLQDSEVPHLTKEITNIMDWIEQLAEVNVDDVEAMAGVGSYTLRLREDVANDGGIAKEVTVNAPEAQFDCFVVPKVIE